ncbi:condensation domain-containing protein [Streptomyces camelliae]|uniref:Condensation domain-containing protein n=1 Tax=Streptomyces camelliae TaxID=3004093 RepID=A0ABY7PG54_9ACTN|nr:condensation domain-containing protein [Streptomyces sp. HUAS 2-6]WBO69601.1 condensation domain-containing protein [Streptomyces sp. HUAS 2-6]
MARSSRRRRVRIRTGRRPAVLGDIVRPAVQMPWQRCEALLDSTMDRSTGRHVEQVWWCWYGPLDMARFVAAWQSVVQRETILRTSFSHHPAPHLVCHPQARAEVTRHPAGTVDWDRLLERDRLRGIDVTRPGPLRITLVDTGEPNTTRVLLTFHHGLLDGGSVDLLQNEFTRAYLADGSLPGGERRPDIRDWMCWLERQDTTAARDFFSRDLSAGTPAVLPVPSGPRTRRHGHGRAGSRLATAEVSRLRRWAALRGLPDSSLLHAAWALLLSREAGTTEPVPVSFGITVSGRGIALDGAERLVGPLRGCLPMTALVDPARPIGALLADLRDRALDMAAYEWVCLGQIQEWTGRSARPLESLVSVEPTPRMLPDLQDELDDAGIGYGRRRTGGAHSLLPVTLLVQDGADGSRDLTVLHDRARLSDTDAGLLADRCARLLCHLPALDDTETVAEVLAALT